MPCNFAYIYFEEFETVRKLPTSNKKITLFSTSFTYEFGIYQKGIKKYEHKFVFLMGCCI
ncbi:hypothetical protein AGR56_11005 [Clostridium sp. DMHC 10]|nr:hypothetical protein AGR56_11005 [Clostridium sp. DMHC 10]